MAVNRSIQEILNSIRTAIFGKDVRESIAEGIEKCYEDVATEGIVHKTDIVDNLTSTSATKVLSAKQGKVLNDKNNTSEESITNLINSMKSVAGMNPMHEALTATAGVRIDSHIYLYAGIRYKIYCSNNDIPYTSENHMNVYVAGYTSVYERLKPAGYTYFTPASDGYLVISNNLANYSGTINIKVSPASIGQTLHGQYKMINSAADLAEVTNGTMSCNDFPDNTIITIGVTSDIGLLNGPNNNYPDVCAGTYITFSIRDNENSKAAECQIMFSAKYAAIFYRSSYTGYFSDWRRFSSSGPIFTSSGDWLSWISSGKLADIPNGQTVCIGSSSIHPVDEPYYGFVGEVISFCHTSLSKGNGVSAGAFQLAVSTKNVMYFRTYVHYGNNDDRWSPWKAINGNTEYHVGSTRDYTSFSSLLYDLKGDKTPKTIYLDDEVFDVFQEYLDLIQEGKLSVPPDNATTTMYKNYSVFVPDNTRIVGYGNATLKMTPSASNVTVGESHMWSPINILNSVEMENVIVLGSNCRYCLHNDSDSETYQQNFQHYKHCKFIFTYTGEYKNGELLGYNNTIGFGLHKDSCHIFEDCEIKMIEAAGSNRGVYYGHENNYGKNGTIILKNCIIHSTDIANTRTIRLQTLGTTEGHVKVLVENCYIYGGLRLELSNEASRNNFDVTFINSNKCPVEWTRPTAPSVPVVDPYTVKWYNPLPQPTAQNPQYEEVSYSSN